MDFLSRMLKGLVVGVANIIPGVSGGTMAVVMGIYDKLIGAVSDLRRDFKNSVLYLFPIGVGALLYFDGPYLLSLLGAKGELHALALSYLRVYALTAPVTTIVFGADSYLRICGQIRTSMFLNIGMAVISFVLEFFFLAVFGWGIWAAAVASRLAIMAGAGFSLFPVLGGFFEV